MWSWYIYFVFALDFVLTILFGRALVIQVTDYPASSTNDVMWSTVFIIMVLMANLVVAWRAIYTEWHVHQFK